MSYIYASKQRKYCDKLPDSEVVDKIGCPWSSVKFKAMIMVMKIRILAILEPATKISVEVGI